MSDPYETLGLTPDEIAAVRSKFRDLTATMNLITSKLLPEHNGRWLVFNHATADFEIVDSQDEAQEKMLRGGGDVSFSLITDRGEQNKPPSVQ